MSWFWSIQKGLTNDEFCMPFGVQRRPLELTFSWLVGPLVACGIEWLICGSASCRGASIDPCPLFRQKTHKSPGSCRKLHSKIIQTSPSVGSLLANLVGTTGAVWKLRGTSPTLMGWASVSLWVEWPNIGAFSTSHLIPGASGSSAEAVELSRVEENWHLRCGPSRGGWWLGYVGIFSCHGVIKTYWRNRKYIEIQSMHRPCQSCCSFLCRIMYTPIQLLPAECRSSHSAKSQASLSSKGLEYKYVIRGPHGVKPPTRIGWTVSGTSAEIWANLWASSLEPLFDVSHGHFQNTHGLCCFPSSCVHVRSRFLSRPLGAAEVGAWQQSLGSSWHWHEAWWAVRFPPAWMICMEIWSSGTDGNLSEIFNRQAHRPRWLLWDASSHTPSLSRTVGFEHLQSIKYPRFASKKHGFLMFSC